MWYYKMYRASAIGMPLPLRFVSKAGPPIYMDVQTVDCKYNDTVVPSWLGLEQGELYQ